MSNWQDLLRGGESRKVLLFLLAVAAVSGAALLLTAPIPQPTPVASSTPAAASSPSGLASDTVLPGYDDASAGTLVDAGPGWTDTVGLVVKLGLVVALLVLALRGLQRLSGRSGRGHGSRRAIDVLESTHLSQGMGLYLVAVGQRLLLLGGTSQQVALLTEVDDPDLLSHLRPSGPAVTDFSQMLDGAARGSAGHAPRRSAK